MYDREPIYCANCLDQCETSVYYWDFSAEEQDRADILRSAITKLKNMKGEISNE